MDHNLREMGVGYLKVPEEMRRMGEAFYGRAQAYQAALAAPDDQMLVDAVTRNIYGGSSPDPYIATRLADYMREAVRDLAVQGAAGLASGELRLPDPASIV
jgi:cytochrome b pre-mRNA-processing protein 3